MPSMFHSVSVVTTYPGKCSFCYPLITELNDLRVIISLKKPQATVERISVCDVIEYLVN